MPPQVHTTHSTSLCCIIVLRRVVSVDWCSGLGLHRVLSGESRGNESLARRCTDHCRPCNTRALGLQQSRLVHLDATHVCSGSFKLRSPQTKAVFDSSSSLRQNTRTSRVLRRRGCILAARVPQHGLHLRLPAALVPARPVELHLHLGC